MAALLSPEHIALTNPDFMSDDPGSYGIAFAWWLFNEQPTLRMLLGGALIIIASVVTSRLKSPSTAAAKPTN